MTCIVGYLDKEQGVVTMGADSAAIAGDFIDVRKDEKIFYLEDFLIGCTSSFRMIQIIRFNFKPKKIEKDIFEYMCTDFVNGIRDVFKEYGFIHRFEEGYEKGGTFLVAYKNRLFKIASDFQVAENLNGMDSIGSGAELAIGALHVLSKQKISNEEKVLKALETSSIFSTTVCEPFIIKTTNK